MQAFVRFTHEVSITYGILMGDVIEEISLGIFDPVRPTGRSFALASVRLLAPIAPPKILAVGLNYKSHLGGRPTPAAPEIFYKPISALQHPGGPIVLPPDAVDVHFEGELVAVIGRTVRNASRDEATAAIFGVTCGNDLSDRHWQFGSGPEHTGKDLQWWRSKGCDTFAPLGPAIVTGANYSDLLLTTRVNGNVVQSQRTSDLIFDLPEIVRYISQYLTLNPGDVIFTGTPGATSKLNPGDVVEVEIENIGILRNDVVRADSRG